MRPTTVALSLVLLAAPAALAQSARNGAYFELGGNAVAPSINYERRLGERWFARGGVSVIVGEAGEETDTTVILPFTASWISHPAGNHHFEAGGGVTFAGGDRQAIADELGGDDETFAGAFLTGILGYRYQKPSGGFQFRAGVTPLAGSGEILPWFGISAGYAW